MLTNHAARRSVSVLAVGSVLVGSSLARPSFFESNGWTLVDDEPDLRIETTVHGWGDDVSVNKWWYGDDATLSGSATGEEDEADVQLDYVYVDGTWVATVSSRGETADGSIRHQSGISENNLSGSAISTGNTPARVDLNSGIDDCDPTHDENCFSGISMVVEGDHVTSDFSMSQNYENSDGWVATTAASGSGSGSGRVETGAVSVFSFYPWLEAAINAIMQGTDGVVTDVESSATVWRP